MRKIFLAAMLAVLGNQANADLFNAGEMKTMWSSWKSLNNKIYNDVEEMKRFTVFVENYIKVQTHNAKNEDVKLKLNQFADLTAQEWKDQHVSGLDVSQKHLEHLEKVAKIESEGFLNNKIDYSLLGLPASVDWRTKGAVTPVKNQQQCGSCWAFSSTGGLEGLNFIKTGKLVSFSEQQLVDCDHVDSGCNGGLMANAFAYTATAGIETEADYPYSAADGKCKYDKSKAQKVNTGSKSITVNNADALKAAIVTQPVSIAIEADQQVFQFYSSGVIKSNCGTTLDHGVLAVGYTTVNGQEAFIVKNSWASSWGQEGYVFISTDKTANKGQGVCGILKMPIVPTA